MVRPLIIATCALGMLCQAEPFTPLGDLPGGDVDSRVYAISGDGRVAIGRSEGQPTPQDLLRPFVWTMDAGIRELGSFAEGGGEGTAYGLSTDGSIIVGYALSERGEEAAAWTPGSTPTPLGGFASLSGWAISSARAVDDSGRIVVGWARRPDLPDRGEVPTRWVDGVAEQLGAIEGIELRKGAFADLTPDGGVAVGTASFETAPRRAFVQVGGGPASYVPVFGADVRSEAEAISADGSTVVGLAQFDGRLEGFAWDRNRGTLRRLGELTPGVAGGATPASWAIDVDATGRVIVGYAPIGVQPWNNAFVWTDVHGLLRLSDVLEGIGAELDGWQLIAAVSVSHDGTAIAGFGFNPEGDVESFIARVPALCVIDQRFDGVADVLDIITYLEKFGAGSVFADLDASGSLDVFDIVRYLELFVRGC